MKKITFLIALLITTSIYAQQAFDCDEGNFYQVISGSIKAYDPVTGSYADALHSYSLCNAGDNNTKKHINNFM